MPFVNMLLPYAIEELTYRHSSAVYDVFVPRARLTAEFEGVKTVGLVWALVSMLDSLWSTVVAVVSSSFSSVLINFTAQDLITV